MLRPDAGCLARRLLASAAIDSVKGYAFLAAVRACTSMAGVLHVPVSFKLTER